MDAAHIRNFSIIAHIDHGKTTLSDRLLHRTGTITTREMEDQLLDSMDLEKERGITIKAHPVTMLYKAKNGETYELNLIDTPGPRGFLLRSVAQPERVRRGVADRGCRPGRRGPDRRQRAPGDEAEPRPSSRSSTRLTCRTPTSPQAKRQLEDILAIPGDSAILASAKEGIGIDEILEAIVERIPAPKPTGAPSLQALGFDSYFDTYKGVVTHVRVFNGELKAGHAGQAAAFRQECRGQGSRQLQSQALRPREARSRARPATSRPTSRARRK